MVQSELFSILYIYMINYCALCIICVHIVHLLQGDMLCMRVVGCLDYSAWVQHMCGVAMCAKGAGNRTHGVRIVVSCTALGSLSSYVTLSTISDLC